VLTRQPAIEVVLFDLGGVLVDFGGVQAMQTLSGIDDTDELWHRWLTCRWVRAFERGGCSPHEFAQGVVDDWALSMTADEYLDAFRQWLGGPLEGAEALVQETRRVVPVSCLSNTNAVHWDENEHRWPLLQAFDVRFLSFELGCVKPDREIFDRVAVALNRPRDRVLFLDDNTLNVDGAIEAGFRAQRARGVEEARRALEAAGVLESR
jgi:putative hydrolase of the HAD superfamily